jgi:hypothetical protein
LRIVTGIDGDENAAAAVFGGVLDQVAENLVEILALDGHRGQLVAV